MNDPRNCESCGMALDSGRYCEHCVDDEGRLQPFERRIEAMTALLMRQQPSLVPAAAEERVKAHMRRMPAWRDHPGLRT